MALMFPKIIYDSSLTQQFCISLCLDREELVTELNFRGSFDAGGCGLSMFLMYEHKKIQIHIWMYIWCFKRANFMKLKIIMKPIIWEQEFCEKDVNQ